MMKNSKEIFVAMIAALLFAGGVAFAAERTLGFDKTPAGSPPAGWKAAETEGKGTLATWQVAADPAAPDKAKVVAITANPNAGGTFNLLLAERPRFKDLKLKLTLKAVAGKEDQGGGPVWRARDANNYYVARGTRWKPTCASTPSRTANASSSPRWRSWRPTPRHGTRSRSITRGPTSSSRSTARK